MLEHISLYHEGHEYDRPSYVDVSKWINTLLNTEFKGRGILLSQLENAMYELVCGAGYISIKFLVSSERERYPFICRVPVEMIAFQPGRHPVVFLLHIIDGIVDELEIFTADSSLIEREISIINVEYKVAESVKAN